MSTKSCSCSTIRDGDFASQFYLHFCSAGSKRFKAQFSANVGNYKFQEDVVSARSSIEILDISCFGWVRGGVQGGCVRAERGCVRAEMGCVRTETPAKRANFRYWLCNPNEKPTGTKENIRLQYNRRNQALKYFCLRDGQLFRKPSNDSEVTRYVVCNYETFERIKETHLQLGHSGINKTFIALNKRYYGISKEEVS
jgi:hypothetical protein